MHIMLSPYEKRRKERVKTRVEVGVVPLPQSTEEERPFHTTGVDVSVSGLAFLSDRTIAAGTPLRVELPLPNTTITLRSTVVRSEPTAHAEKWKVAVRFEPLSNECLRLLGWFVKEEGRKQLLGQVPQPASSISLSANSVLPSRSSAGSKPQLKTASSPRLTPNLALDISAATSSDLTARRLRRGEESVVCDFLNRQPLRNVVLLGAVCDYGLESQYHRGSFYGCFRHEELIGVALIGRHIVLSCSEESVAVFADVARLNHEPEPQMVLGEVEIVEEFCQILTEPPCSLTVRLAQIQILYTMTEMESGVKEIKGLRLAQTDEREDVAQVHARICKEDTGVDPMAQDPAGFRRRMLARIERGREWILRDGSGIVFKTDVIFETEEAIYLEGVWVRPDLRGIGLETKLLKSLCQQLLRHHRAVCVFADGEDEPINAFYREVGFTAAAPYRVARFSRRNKP
jgi:predicted GNAT family acetyltransferase